MPVAELTEAELEQWGAAYGRALAPPAWIALRGDLGAGKTTLVRAIVGAIVRAQGPGGSVTSPTYSVVRDYDSPKGRVFHLDLYRLRRPEEIHQLGWEEIARDGAVVLVEWPDVAGAALPADCANLLLEHVPGRPDVRRLSW